MIGYKATAVALMMRYFLDGVRLRIVCSVPNRERHCLSVCGSIFSSRILAENGAFHELKTVSKRLARIGLLFSAVTPTIKIGPESVRMIDDIESPDGKVRHLAYSRTGDDCLASW